MEGITVSNSVRNTASTPNSTISRVTSADGTDPTTIANDAAAGASSTPTNYDNTPVASENSNKIRAAIINSSAATDATSVSSRPNWTEWQDQFRRMHLAEDDIQFIGD